MNKILSIFILAELILYVQADLSQIKSECIEATKYWNTMTLTCEECNSAGNFIRNANGDGCVCKPNFILQNQSGVGFITTTCISCADGSVANRKECLVQQEANQLKQIAEYQETGEALANTSIFDCSTFSKPSKETNYCVPCPSNSIRIASSGTCQCNDTFLSVQNDDDEQLCVLLEDIEDRLGTSVTGNLSGLISEIEYIVLNQENYNQEYVNSYFISKYYQYNSAACLSYSDIKACNVLINMCVLAIYNKNNKLCETIFTYQRQVTGMADTFLASPGSTLDFRVTFNPDNETDNVLNKLPLYLRRLDRFGNELDFDLLDDQLILCPHTVEESEEFKKFGVDFQNECSLSMDSYILNYDSVFYEIYIKNENDFHNIPIQVKYKDKEGNLVFQNEEEKEYVTRFQMVDNFSSISEEGGQAKFLRYAKNIKIKFLVSNDILTEQVIVIEYETKEISNGVLLDITESELSFKIEYRQDTPQFWVMVTILFFGFFLGICFLIFIRFYIWLRYNPSDVVKKVDQNFTLQLIINFLGIAMGSFAQGFFYFIFIITGYVFVFYKLQDFPYYIMPSLEEEYSSNYAYFDRLFYPMAFFSIISTIYLVYKQTSVDLFFIDWEADPNFKEAEDRERGISIWRTLFVANEFNELATERKLKVEWNLMALGFFMAGLEWENLQAETPLMVTEVYNIEKNYILKYFIATFVYLCIGLVQLLFHTAVEFWFPLKIKEFIDLCTIGNISVFILDHDLHGYYIHGKSPKQSAEGNALWIQTALQNEKMPRGLLAQNTSADMNELKKVQAFEMLITKQLRKNYETLNVVILDESKKKKKSKNKSKDSNANDVEDGNSKKQLEEDQMNNSSDKLQLKQKQVQKEELKKEYEDQLKRYQSDLKAFNEESNRKKLNKYLKSKIKTSADKGKGQALEQREWVQRYFGIPNKNPQTLEDEQNRTKEGQDMNNIDNNHNLADQELQNLPEEIDHKSSNYWPFFYFDTNYSIQSLFFIGKEMQLLFFNIYTYNLFDVLFGSTLAAIVLTYIVDKCITYLRGSWGQQNIADKTLIKDKFLI